MIYFDKITEIYCVTDELCKYLEKTTASLLLETKQRKSLE
jgi:hypothetical protein